ncbi:unnamed protein product [Adineta steineri]|uniref:PLAT domain-containing protein n=1 Tax=Adineta steineri TaxID=433720 RepID=A0A814NJH7_9BILA|nr:unnamed protein product [Adineta steineri]
MANITNDSTDLNPRPCLDRLTHAVLKETSKSLKYYIDVKRRENAFVLNTNSSVCDTIPLKTKFLYRTKKQYTSSSNSLHIDKNISSNFQQNQKYNNMISTSPEKQMCREELNFHMRSYHFSSNENLKNSRLHQRSKTRSNSLYTTNRDIQLRSPFKVKRHEQDQLIDNTADILASMVKSRRSFCETNSSIQHTPLAYLSQITNHFPHQIDDQSNIQTSPTTDLRTLSINKGKPKTKDFLTKSAFIMKKSKLINQGILCEYKISITTGNCNGASTNAPIRIKLYGTNGHINFYELVHSETHHIPFLKDQTDIFKLETYHIGELIGITIGHDRKDMKASWFLNKISIDDPIRHITYEIPCNTWLSIKSNDQKTMRSFQVVSKILHKKIINLNVLTQDKKSLNLLEHQEENGSQSGSSTLSVEGTLTSNISNRSKTSSLIDSKQTKKHHKQRRVSIDPTLTTEKSTSVSTNTDNHSQSALSPKTETYSNQNEVPYSVSISVHQYRSPNLSATSSDTEIEGNIMNQTHSTTPTPSPTLNQIRLKSVSENDTLQIKSTNNIYQRYSIDPDRPPARLEQRSPILYTSLEQSLKNKQEQ